jgi:hypothetical protein
MSERQVESPWASERDRRKNFVLNVQKHGGVAYEVRGWCFRDMISEELG